MKILKSVMKFIRAYQEAKYEYFKKHNSRLWY